MGTHPTNDWRLLDVFTATMSQNASVGLLSVNQTNIAAWSAVLSGVSVLSNSASGPAFSVNYIQPASPQLTEIVAGINKARTNFSHGKFRTVGDILSAPELTEVSPMLLQRRPGLVQGQPDRQYSDYKTQFMTEEAVERIPQQILGLLKSDEPRVVIYSFGQALKPAERSIVTMGPFYNMCTNYQVTAEVVTKAVVRFDGPEDNPKAVVESFSIVPNQ